MNSAITRALAELQKEVKNRKDVKGVIDAIDITEQMAPVYRPLHQDIKSGLHRAYNLPGGRGSGKSSFCSLEVVNGIMQDQTGAVNAIVFRRIGNTIRDSVYNQISWAINVLDVSALWYGTISPLAWTYKPTGAQILFRGLDDETKIKSIKPRKGYFKYIWLEEFSELPGERFLRSVMQSVYRGGVDYVVFRSFNPPLNKNNWANVFVTRPDDKALTLYTSYLDVPPAWLGEDFILEAERLKNTNETAYRHEYLGEATGSGGEVFPNIEARKITDAEIKEMQYIYCGVDFGFSIDPAVFICVAYDRKHDVVYFIDEIYKRGLSNRELARLIKEKGYQKTGEFARDIYTGTLYEGKRLIICDSAEPKSIADLQGEGLKAIACRKYPGCVLYRIKWLQNRRLVIDPARTPNAYKEFISYEYMTTKDGEFLADVPDANNHTIDATAYALDRVIYSGKEPA